MVQTCDVRPRGNYARHERDRSAASVEIDGSERASRTQRSLFFGGDFQIHESSRPDRAEAGALPARNSPHTHAVALALTLALSVATATS